MNGLGPGVRLVIHRDGINLRVTDYDACEITAGTTSATSVWTRGPRVRTVNRKTTPKVRDGRVQKKNNWEETANYYNTYQAELVIDRKRPGFGYRHLLKQQDIRTFIGLLPEWNELSRELDAVVLAPGRADVYGYYTPGVVHICAWPIELDEQFSPPLSEDRRGELDFLSVPYERRGGYVQVHWTEWTARAHQLLFTFLHELGHHHDALTTKEGGEANRGEAYADAYARKYADLLWTRYREAFPDPS